jgi:hypothetical protein
MSIDYSAHPELNEALETVAELLLANDSAGVFLIFDKAPVTDGTVQIDLAGTHDARVSQTMVLIAASYFSPSVDAVLKDALADLPGIGGSDARWEPISINASDGEDLPLSNSADSR